MAVLMTEGFDMYNGVGANIGLQARWVRFIAGGGAGDGVTTGRFGGQSYFMRGDSGSNIRCVLPGSYMGFGHGFAYKENDSVNNRSGFMNLLNSGLGGVISLNVNASLGGVTVNGPGGAIGSASGLPLTAVGVWHYFEVYGTVNATTGTCMVYLDGSQIINVTGVNTGSSAVAGLQYTTSNLGGGGGSNVVLDDIFVADSATRLGECRIETMRPTGDSTVAWTPNSGSNNYSRVNESVVDGDTNYVQTSTIGARDLYGIGGLSSTPSSIFAVNVVAFAEKTDATTRSLYNSVRSGLTDSDGAAAGLTASYLRYERILTTDPNTSAAWTASGVNNLLIGPKAA